MDFVGSIGQTSRACVGPCGRAALDERCPIESIARIARTAAIAGYPNLDMHHSPPDVQEEHRLHDGAHRLCGLCEFQFGNSFAMDFVGSIGQTNRA